MTRSPRLRIAARGWLVVGAIAVIIVLLPYTPLFSPSFRLAQLQGVGALVIILVGLNLLTGLAGAPSLGHAGFVLVGSTATAVLVDRGVAGSAVHPAVAIAAATAATGGLGLLLAQPLQRLRGNELAIATFGFAVAAQVVIRWSPLSELTGGAGGVTISRPVAPSAIDTLVTDAQWRYFIIALPALGSCYLAWRLQHGRLGRLMRAVRDNELAAVQLGIDAQRVLRLAFCLSAAYAGFGGALLTYASVGASSPDSYGLLESLDYLVALVIGGLGSVPGAVIGALVLGFEDELTRVALADRWSVALRSRELLSAPSPLAGIDRAEALLPGLYGAVAIVIVLFAPRGLSGLAGRGLRRLARYWTRG